jgi:hypothetical protein
MDLSKVACQPQSRPGGPFPIFGASIHVDWTRPSSFCFICSSIELAESRLAIVWGTARLYSVILQLTLVGRGVGMILDSMIRPHLFHLPFSLNATSVHHKSLLDLVHAAKQTLLLISPLHFENHVSPDRDIRHVPICHDVQRTFSHYSARQQRLRIQQCHLSFRA